MEKIKLLKAILIFSIFIFVNVSAGRSETSQFWHRETISGIVTTRLVASFHTESRLGDGLEDYYYQHTEFQLSYRANRWLSVAPAYRQVQSRRPHAAPDEGRFLQHMLLMNVKGEYNWTSIGFSNRMRVERIILEIDGEKQWRFRNRIQIDFPQIYRRCQLQPILSAELFYMKQKDGFYRSWLTAGLNAVLLRYLHMAAFYRVEDDFRVFRRIPIYGIMVQFNSEFLKRTESGEHPK